MLIWANLISTLVLFLVRLAPEVIRAKKEIKMLNDEYKQKKSVICHKMMEERKNRKMLNKLNKS